MVAEEFSRFVADKLGLLSARLTNQLRQLVEHTYPSEVDALEFEVFPDGFTSGFPVRTYFVDSNRTEYFRDTAAGPEYPSPIDPGLLSIEGVFLESDEAAFIEQDPELDTYILAAEALVPWFAKSWREAGGASFRLRASIGIHDESRRFDLRSNAWLAG